MARDYLKHLESWHQQFAWFQRASKEKKSKYGKPWFLSAPSPWAIINAAYGDIIKSNETLKKNLYERLIPCIVEKREFPYDLVNLAVHRASNRNNCAHWEWESNLGVACGLFRGFFNRHPDHNLRRDYPMALDTKYESRDYLYGRLLAIAEHIEEMAMFVAGESPRSTQASRLMQRFSDHPASTWLLIEKGLVPYQDRLRSKLAPLEAAYRRLIDDVCNIFEINDFNAKEKLSGEYLLGFHCQRKWLREHKLEKGQWILKPDSNMENENQQGDK
jgi:CRISPR-associated protein Csd1